MKSQWIQAVGAVALVATCISAQVALIALGNVFRSATRPASAGPAAEVGPAWAGIGHDVRIAASCQACNVR